MGKLANLNTPRDWNRLEERLVADCPECDNEINATLMLIRLIRNPRDKTLESLGICSSRLVMDQSNFRRRWSLTLSKCGGEVSFYWKKSTVDNINIVCDHGD